MSIDPKKISARIAEIVNKFRLLWRYMTLGPTSLKTHEIKLLIKEGMLHPKHYKPTMDDAYMETHIDLLTHASKKSVRDYSIKHLKESAGKYIDKFADKVSIELSSIVNNNLLIHAQRLREITKDTVGEAVEQHKTARQIVQLLRDKTKDLYKDWDRVCSTELGNAQNLGAVDAMLANSVNTPHTEIYAYKVVVNDQFLCVRCRKFWLMPDGVTPKVYKLSDLLANGSNYGKKAVDWLPTSTLSHPNSIVDSKTLVLTNNGWTSIAKIKVGDLALTHTGHFRKVLSTWSGSIEHPLYYRIHFQYKSDNQLDHAVSLTLTPDHKVLTNNGWKEARMLDARRDKLIKVLHPCKICEKPIDLHLGYTKKFLQTCSEECRKKLQALNTRKQWVAQNADPEFLQQFKDNISSKIKTNWETGVYEATRVFLKSESHRLSNKLRCLAGGARKAMLGNQKTSKPQRLLYNKLQLLFPEYDFVLEYPLLSYSIDVAIPSRKIAIEFDGSYWHKSEERKAHDVMRQQTIEAQGWTVIRFTDKELASDIISGKCSLILNNHNAKYTFQEIDIIAIIKHKSSSHQKIYDITVECDESFIARGVVVHNCREVLLQLPLGWGFKNGALVYVSENYSEYDSQNS